MHTEVSKTIDSSVCPPVLLPTSLWPSRLAGVACHQWSQFISLQRRAQEGIDDHFKGKGAKAFADNYREWWELVVREAAAVEILFDSFVLERLLNLVTLMARCVPKRSMLQLWRINLSMFPGQRLMISGR